ncbi:MAG: hypothetical protein KIT87_30190, partial [Anaerolineae bacterium]|nr:hypothetical protein [Anaerolineae bacterium]
KGVGGNNEVFVIVECRRYTRSRQNQERIGGLAYRIIDTGAKGGILVSPLGMQEGAAKIAHAENIHNVILDKNSTTTQYLMHFLNKVRYGIEVSLDTDVTVSWSPQITQDDKTVEDSGEA